MKILILNFILYTADNNIIPKVKSIKDTMIYNMCLGFKQLGHEVTLGAAEDFKPTEKENYDFDVIFFKTDYKRVFPPSVLVEILKAPSTFLSSSEVLISRSSV